MHIPDYTPDHEYQKDRKKGLLCMLEFKKNLINPCLMTQLVLSPWDRIGNTEYTFFHMEKQTTQVECERKVSLFSVDTATAAYFSLV